VRRRFNIDDVLGSASLAAIDEDAHYQARLIVKLVDLNEQTGEFRTVNVGI